MNALLNFQMVAILCTESYRVARTFHSPSTTYTKYETIHYTQPKTFLAARRSSNLYHHHHHWAAAGVRLMIRIVGQQFHPLRLLTSLNFFPHLHLTAG